MFKFRDFMSALRNIAKSVFARIFAKFKYFAKQFLSTERGCLKSRTDFGDFTLFSSVVKGIPRILSQLQTLHKTRPHALMSIYWPNQLYIERTYVLGDTDEVSKITMTNQFPFTLINPSIP